MRPDRDDRRGFSPFAGALFDDRNPTQKMRVKQ